MDHLEEIKARLSIEELVGSYVQLKKAGRNLKGLCPFHNDKNPSLMVSPEKEIAYCFSCNNGGDIFKFIQLIENVNFNEAVKILAEKTGVRLPHVMPKANNKRLKNIEINNWTVKFYEEQLEKNLKQKEYFLKRGLNDEIIKKFKLGFAPDSFDKLKNYLLQKGFEEKDLIEASVVNQRSMADKNTYDRFRNRLIFPIFDHQDNPVGFSGRIIGEGEPKYLNSPETPAYNKSLILYGLNWAKEYIKKENMAIFVEGYMDVISAHKVGNSNVIATCGTAITPQQLKLIKRYTKNIAFAFDQDSAGLEATFRAIELAQMTDLNIKIITIPGGKDPDESIKNNPEEWEKAVKNPINVMDFYLSYALQKFDKNTIEGKGQILNLLLPLIKIYKSDVERSIYLNKLAIELKTDVRFLWNDLKNMDSKKTFNINKNKENDVKSERNKIFNREEFLLGFIFCYPEIYEHVANNLIDTIPIDQGTEKFYNVLKKVYTLKSSLNMSDIRAELNDKEGEQISIFSLLIDEHYPDFPEDAVAKEVLKLIKEINKKNLSNKQKNLEIQIRTTEDNQEKKLLLNKYNEMLKLANKI